MPVMLLAMLPLGLLPPPPPPQRLQEINASVECRECLDLDALSSRNSVPNTNSCFGCKQKLCEMSNLILLFRT